MKICLSLTLITLMFVSVPLASAQISNGSFENLTGNIGGGFGLTTPITPFTELGEIVTENLGTASSWDFGRDASIVVGQTTDGNAAAWLRPNTLDGDAVISQIFSIGNTGSYSLRWDSFANLGFARTGFAVDQVAETPSRYNVDLSEAGGASLFNADFSESLFDGLPTSHSVPFSATAGLYTLTFTGLGGPQGTALSARSTFIDNVRVVPEPGSALIAIAAGLGFLARRRRSCLMAC